MQAFKAYTILPRTFNTITSNRRLTNQATIDNVNQSLSRLRVVLGLENMMIHRTPKACQPLQADNRYEVQNVHYYSDDHPSGISFRYGGIDITYGAWINWCFVIRPKLKETLELLSQHADLYLFSRTSDQFNKEVVNIIDPSGKFFKKLLGKSNFVDINEKGEIEPGGYLKEIKLIENDFLEARTVLVDTSSFRWDDLEVRPQNSLVVTGFDQVKGFDKPPVERDEALYNLAKLIVEKLVPAPDIRNLIQDYKIKET